jgi:hypothetical protein
VRVSAGPMPAPSSGAPRGDRLLTEAADRCTWLVIIVHTQLRLVQPLDTDPGRDPSAVQADLGPNLRWLRYPRDASLQLHRDHHRCSPVRGGFGLTRIRE